MNLVIVESPAKAKTINKYLGNNYKVLASYGHIRDLPSKNGSVNPEQDFKMEWEVDSFSKKYLKEITDAAKDSSKIILATDPDREGEAIAWHVKEYLNEKKLLKDKEIQRVVFNEITKKAVIHGIENPRQIEPLLVDAYMARRALDYLVGFNISPILWTKLPGSKSAGRVQSVALKLITEREHEIESFKPEEFWTLSVKFVDEKNQAYFPNIYQCAPRHSVGGVPRYVRIPIKNIPRKRVVFFNCIIICAKSVFLTQFCPVCSEHPLNRDNRLIYLPSIICQNFVLSQ